MVICNLELLCVQIIINYELTTIIKSKLYSMYELISQKSITILKSAKNLNKRKKNKKLHIAAFCNIISFYNKEYKMSGIDTFNNRTLTNFECKRLLPRVLCASKRNKKVQSKETKKRYKLDKNHRALFFIIIIYFSKT